MSTALLVTLTVIEIVALVVVLALFVILITHRLRSIANALRPLCGGGIIWAIHGDVFLVGAGAAILNRKLNAIAGALPAITQKAESLASKQTQAQTSQQTQAQTSGTGWQPAVAQDPVIKRS
jgi:hypothetical protein